MDIDTSRSMRSEAAKYLRYAKQCADAAEGEGVGLLEKEVGMHPA